MEEAVWRTSQLGPSGYRHQIARAHAVTVGSSSALFACAQGRRSVRLATMIHAGFEPDRAGIVAEAKGPGLIGVAFIKPDSLPVGAPMTVLIRVVTLLTSAGLCTGLSPSTFRSR